MKKVVICTLSLLFLLTGCGGNSKEEELMKNYGKSYYEEYMKKVEGLTEAHISISNLENVNKTEGTEKYDLSSLKKCKKDSYVALVLEGHKISKYEFYLDC